MYCLIVNEYDGILSLRLNRPEKHNALNADLLATLHQAFLDAKERHSVKAILLIGNGKIR